MKRFKIGSYDWVCAGDTSLNLREKVQLFGQLISSQLLDALNTFGNKSGIYRSKLARVDSSKITIPDSSISKSALEYANDMYDAPLLNHCIRTFLWGALLSQYHNQRPDMEFLYVAGLLHDAGLSGQHRNKIDQCCFAVTGAGEAMRFVQEKGWSSHKSIAMFNAISMHLNPLISKSNTEAFLVKSGAYMDLFGNRNTCISKAEKIKIIDQYPRLDFNEEILNVDHFPGSRAAYFSKFGAVDLSRKNPLNKLVR